MSAEWRSCRKIETGARIDKWGGEYPLHTAGPPRSQASHVRSNPVYTRDSLLRTHAHHLATQPSNHSMTSQMVSFMFTVSFAKTGRVRQYNERLNLADILKSDRARFLHCALKIFHSDFSCSNINSCSWERRARLMNDCSSCETPTGLPQRSCVPLHSQPKDFANYSF